MSIDGAFSIEILEYVRWLNKEGSPIKKRAVVTRLSIGNVLNRNKTQKKEIKCKYRNLVW